VIGAKLVRNLGAGLQAPPGWLCWPWLAVPLYLRYLGLEAYGLIGFFATSQALIPVAGSGHGAHHQPGNRPLRSEWPLG